MCCICACSLIWIPWKKLPRDLARNALQQGAVTVPVLVVVEAEHSGKKIASDHGVLEAPWRLKLEPSPSPSEAYGSQISDLPT
jgi:hypothetical protein